MCCLSSAKIHDFWGDQKSAKIFDIRENESKGGHASMQIPIMLCFNSTQLLQATLTFVVEWIVYIKFSVENWVENRSRFSEQQVRIFRTDGFASRPQISEQNVLIFGSIISELEKLAFGVGLRKRG